MTECCAICRFWRVIGKGDAESKAWIFSECLRHGPVLLTYLPPGHSYTPEGQWPQTRGRDWCGEFTPRSEMS